VIADPVIAGLVIAGRAVVGYEGHASGCG